MSKNPANDPITDQEIEFARLILSGTMTDRQAAEIAGLNPATAAYTKAKPRVQAWMAEHRAAVHEKLVDQEVQQQTEELRAFSIGRELILKRLWELATLSPELTRGSITGQVKSMSMIVAIEGLIPDRRRAPLPQQPAPQPAPYSFYIGKPYRADYEARTGQKYVEPELELHRNSDEKTDQRPSEAATSVEPAPASATPEPEAAIIEAQNAPSRQSDGNPAHPTNPIVTDSRATWVPDARDSAYDSRINDFGPIQRPFSSRKGPFSRDR